MQDQYLEITSRIPTSSALYGLGERVPSTGMQLQRNGIPLALWNRDNPAADADQNIYSSHPNYIELREGAPQLAMPAYPHCASFNIVIVNSVANDSCCVRTENSQDMGSPNFSDLCGQLCQPI